MLAFSRAQRLVKQHDFQFVFAKPGKVSYQYLLALYRPNQQRGARLGIVIKKNLVRHAVDRNRLRRVIRESFRHHQEKLTGLDIIVIVRTQITPLLLRNSVNLERAKKTLRDNVNQLWRQFGIP